MPTTLDELTRLSDNSPLWKYLADGGAAEAIESCPANTAQAELCRSVRAALVPLLRDGSDSALVALVDGADTVGKISILGELILGLNALRAGGVADESRTALLRKATTKLALDSATALEADPPQDSDDAELLAHGIALREWAHLFAEYYRAEGVPNYHAELLMVRARATNCTLTYRHDLVGSAMLDIAIALEAIGNLTLAVRCYEGIRRDLRILVDRIDRPFLGSFELACGLFWLQGAYEHSLRHEPDNAELARQLAELRALREARGDPDAISAPRFGPIAKTYLAPVPYLALILDDLQRNYRDDTPRECTAAICRRYGCTSDEVEFYLSAIGSYRLRAAFGATGPIMMYDDAHLEVFTALDHLHRLG